MHRAHRRCPDDRARHVARAAGPIVRCLRDVRHRGVPLQAQRRPGGVRGARAHAHGPARPRPGLDRARPVRPFLERPLRGARLVRRRPRRRRRAPGCARPTRSASRTPTSTPASCGSVSTRRSRSPTSAARSRAPTRTSRCSPSAARCRSTSTSWTARDSPAPTASQGSPGRHGVGHTRLATESRVDVQHAHPFWARPFADICVVHNGHITNYHKLRRLYEMTRPPLLHRQRLRAAGAVPRPPAGGGRDDPGGHGGVDPRPRRRLLLPAARRRDGLGMCRDRVGSMPGVVAETDDWVAVASASRSPSTRRSARRPSRRRSASSAWGGPRCGRCSRLRAARRRARSTATLKRLAADGRARDPRAAPRRPALPRRSRCSTPSRSASRARSATSAARSATARDFEVMGEAGWSIGADMHVRLGARPRRRRHQRRRAR